MDWYEIAGIVMGAIGLLWGGWKLLKHIPREIAEAFTVIANAIEDDNITREELKQIVESFRDIWLAVQKIVGK